MYKWRDFYLMKVYDSKNKYIGVIEDISIDFSKGIIEGFTISPASIIKRHTFVLREDIVSIDNVMKITSTSKFRGLKFKDIKSNGDGPLVLCGEAMKGDIKESIQRGDWEPDAEATVRAKERRGKSEGGHPLIDTGDLLKSIIYEVFKL